MTTDDLNNKAYLIATGNCLTEAFNKAEYDAMTAKEVYNYVWEPFEQLTPKDLCIQIEQIANGIINNFNEFVTE